MNGFRRETIGILLFASIWIGSAILHDYRQSKRMQAVINYLKSPEMVNQFRQQGSVEVEILPQYPKFIRYVTYTDYDGKSFSDIQTQDANAEKCDFIYDIFKQLHAQSQEKKAILKALKQQHIQFEHIYRNKYADILYRTQVQTIETDCVQWYAAPEQTVQRATAEETQRQAEYQSVAFN